MDFLAQLQISSFRFGLLLTSDSEEIFVNQRVDVALKIDLFLDPVHGLVKFFQVDIHPKNALLKLQKDQKIGVRDTYANCLDLVHAEHRGNRDNLRFDVDENGAGRVCMERNG